MTAIKPDEPRSLTRELLAQQQDLTAVTRFSRWHDGGTACATSPKSYRDLIPLTAPAPGRQYAFEVDLDRCSGCKACVSACHSLNGLDDGEAWRDTGLLISNDWRRPFQQVVTTACHHCVEPGCLEGCPVLAYDKDPLTGIVKHLDDQCIGCQYCVMKCPYDVPKYSASRGIVRKCDLCSSRLAAGEAPACVQACPTSAIKITTVETARVRGRFRGVPGMGADATNHWLPASPNPAITLPTTRYRTKRALPDHLQAADHEELKPEPAHWPLVFMLVLTQMSVGMFLLGTLAGVFAGEWAGGRFAPWQGMAATVIGIAGLIASVAHLGRPLGAWRSFLGLRTSWLSREIVGFGLFAGLAVAASVAAWSAHSSFPLTPALSLGEREEHWAAARATDIKLSSAELATLQQSADESERHSAFAYRTPALPLLPQVREEGRGEGEQGVRMSRIAAFPLALLTAVIGLLGVFCSVMVYADTRREYWRLGSTVSKFFGTTFVLGALGTLLVLLATGAPIAAVQVVAGMAAVAGACKLASDQRVLRHLPDDDFSPLHKTALLLSERFGRWNRTRAAGTVLGGIGLPALIALQLATQPPAHGTTVMLVEAVLALALCLGGELIERALFFITVQPLKMPGSVISGQGKGRRA
jgi:formate dehydrogenase iron-sulfur subunit